MKRTTNGKARYEARELEQYNRYTAEAKQISANLLIRRKMVCFKLVNGSL